MWCREKIVVPKNKPMVTLQGYGQPMIEWNDRAS